MFAPTSIAKKPGRTTFESETSSSSHHSPYKFNERPDKRVVLVEQEEAMLAPLQYRVVVLEYWQWNRHGSSPNFHLPTWSSESQTWCPHYTACSIYGVILAQAEELLSTEPVRLLSP